jgi:DNA-binding winged helix-turn-helix (wHTH) protein
MAVYLQPCDWVEQDVNFKYVIDVFGRTQNGDVAKLRITEFEPYFYLKMYDGENSAAIQSILRGAERPIRDAKITLESKHDAMCGFSSLTPTRVWKIQCKSLWSFKSAVKSLQNAKIGSRTVKTEDIYESDLPPLLRFFHQRDINPATIEIRGGEIAIDEHSYTAKIKGRSLDLTYKEFELLKYLVQHPGRVFTRSQLLQEVWGYDYFGGTRTVDVHIRRLRAKLGPEHEALIGTVRHVGYRFNAANGQKQEAASLSDN